MLRISLLLLPVLALAACDGAFEPGAVKGSGKITTEARPVGKFTAVQLSGIGQVVIEPAETESLTLTVDDNLAPLFTSQVKDGTLLLATVDGKNPGRAAIFKVTVSDLRAIAVSGSGSVEAAKVEAGALSISVSGSGSAKAAGRADSVTISVSGSGTADASNLKAKRAKVSVSGSGDATVNASDDLDASVSGSGHVRFIGEPKLTSQVLGSGAVDRARR
jgi:hypothetical protein